MPYIDENKKYDIDNRFVFINTPGELNYFFSKEINLYLHHKGLSSQTINDILGALEGAKIEFYNKIAKPYEEKKCKENGDVYSREFISEGEK